MATIRGRAAETEHSQSSLLGAAKYFFLALLLLSISTLSITGAQGLGDRNYSVGTPSQDVGEAELEAFIAALQKAVAADDRQKVASMIRYPIVILAGGRSVLFKSPSSLVASYDLVFTARRKKLIAEARAEDLFGNWRGAMIDNGDIWINTVDSGGLKIVTVNNEPGAKAPEPLAPVLKVHPKVFSLIDCWESDSEYPVVTEIN